MEGQRVHAWIFVAAGSRNVKEHMFIEPSTGFSHLLSSDLYCGIESMWNHENYWVSTFVVILNNFFKYLFCVDNTGKLARLFPRLGRVKL